jgi:hypothetical protein
VCHGHIGGENSKSFECIGQQAKLFLNAGLKLIALPYFCANFIPMEVRKKNRGLYWLLFFISAAALAFAIYAHWPWLTLLLPFVGTFFVLAMDII